jgi:molybdate transport system substrate-binding protein
VNSLLIAATILVSAASSLTDVLAELARRYEAAGGDQVMVNAGASNTLARQIVEGAPVDLFISADEAQMDLVERAGRLLPGSRVALLRNRLVVIVPASSRTVVAGPRDLTSASVRRIAIGNPEGVPAGVYARSWLERLGLWSALRPKVVPLPTVRAALAAVRESRADAGIVYATDVRNETGVRVAFEPPSTEAPVVVYPAAIVRGPRQDAAKRFLEYLQSDAAAAMFESAGFSRSR